MKTTGLLLALVLVSATIAHAGDYYVYTDAAGKIWLSNQDPRNKDESPTRRPDDVTIVKQYRWQDVTDEQIAASAAAERELAQVNTARDMAMNLERLANELALARLERLQQGAVVNEPIIVVNTGRLRRFHRVPLITRPAVTKGRR
jgi:hypothetical protein